MGKAVAKGPLLICEPRIHDQRNLYVLPVKFTACGVVGA